MQSNLGAKNHAVVLPDADIDSTVKALAGRLVAIKQLIQHLLYRKSVSCLPICISDDLICFQTRGPSRFCDCKQFILLPCFWLVH